MTKEKIENMLTAYCGGKCEECRFSTICDWIHKYPVEDHMAQYKVALGDVLRPHGRIEIEILKKIREKMINSSKSEFYSEKEAERYRAQGLLTAYNIITGLSLAADDKGNISEENTDFKVFPLV